jgi:hypothetical protein
MLLDGKQRNDAHDLELDVELDAIHAPRCEARFRWLIPNNSFSPLALWRTAADVRGAGSGELAF